MSPGVQAPQGLNAMPREEEKLQRTPLYSLHVESGARMTSFTGWEMPLQYRGIHDECLIVRSKVGLFDISHMGQILVRGKRSTSFLEYLLPGNIANLKNGRMMYAVLCNEQGGTVDDIVVYCLSNKEYLLVVNAGRIQVDETWIQSSAKKFEGIAVRNISNDKGMLAIQGPQAEEFMSSLASDRLRGLQYHTFHNVTIEGQQVLVSRSGYTGEDGFELICEAGSVGKIWSALRRRGIHPCGLGARDVLRTEMGYCLYGHELDQSITPLEARLSWTLELGKEHDFIGKKSLLLKRQAGTYRGLAGFRLLEKGIPRPGYAVCSGQGERIGRVSSGTYSPSLEQGIGLAFLEPRFRKIGSSLQVDMRGKLRRAEVVRLPFLPSKLKR